MGRDKRRGQALGVLVVAVIVGVIGGAVAGALVARSMIPPVSQGELIKTGGQEEVIKVDTSDQAIPAAVKKMTPSVVKIDTLNAPSAQDLYQQWMSGIKPGQPIAAIGSGFIFDYAGRKLVMTNNHVVGSAVKARVRLTDGRHYTAKLIGADVDRDLAVVELEGAPNDLVGASLGDSDKLVVGEWVIAMGNPYGYDNTVTVGVVSAKGYRPVGERQMRNVIQTDAPINPGNSGGPLVDLGGNVVGINYKISSPTGATVGIGFAIPINEAKMVAKVLIDGGPWIGLSEGDLMPNSKAFAAHFQLPTEKGVVVLSVTSGSPAAAAGIKAGDIILDVNGKAVAQITDVLDPVLTGNIGDKVQMTVQNAGGTQQVSITLGKIPPSKGGAE